jgi:hypothetical protein
MNSAGVARPALSASKSQDSMVVPIRLTSRIFPVSARAVSELAVAWIAALEISFTAWACDEMDRRYGSPSEHPPAPGGLNASAAGILATTVR